MRRRILAIILSVIAILVVGGLAFSRFGGRDSDQTAGSTVGVVEATESENAPLEKDAISVDARVVPVLSADLSLAANGIVAEVLVIEGERVKAGQPLVRLESARQKAVLAQAQAQLQRAEAQLAQAQAGAREQEIAAARAGLDAAQARLDRIQQGEGIASAQASFTEAQAALQKLREGARGDLLIASEAEIANAQARLRQTQAAYDKVSALADVGARPESAQLEQATNAVAAAQSRLNDLKAGASAADLTAAGARVSRAQAQLQELQATQPASIAAAQAEVRQLMAQLDLLAAGARPEQIQALDADVAAAQAAVAQAQAALEDTELRAPFAGSIAALNAKAGEQAAAGAPIIQLADLGQWQIETDDLTEFSAVAIQPGDAVAIGYDALPELQHTGKVKLIRPIGQNNRGDIVYTVVVMPDQQEERLLWNMTAIVTFAEE